MELKGMVLCPKCKGTLSMECPECDGNGHSRDTQCTKCGGSGEIECALCKDSPFEGHVLEEEEEIVQDEW